MAARLGPTRRPKRSPEIYRLVKLWRYCIKLLITSQETQHDQYYRCKRPATSLSRPPKCAAWPYTEMRLIDLQTCQSCHPYCVRSRDAWHVANGHWHLKLASNRVTYNGAPNGILTIFSRKRPIRVPNLVPVNICVMVKLMEMTAQGLLITSQWDTTWPVLRKKWSCNGPTTFQWPLQMWPRP